MQVYPRPSSSIRNQPVKTAKSHTAKCTDQNAFLPLHIPHIDQRFMQTDMHRCMDKQVCIGSIHTPSPTHLQEVLVKWKKTTHLLMNWFSKKQCLNSRSRWLRRRRRRISHFVCVSLFVYVYMHICVHAICTMDIRLPHISLHLILFVCLGKGSKLESGFVLQ